VRSKKERSIIIYLIQAVTVIGHQPLNYSSQLLNFGRSENATLLFVLFTLIYTEFAELTLLTVPLLIISNILRSTFLVVQYIQSDEDDAIIHVVTWYNNLICAFEGFLIFALLVFIVKRSEIIEKILQKSPILTAMN
jgi:hypothetical protein